MTARKRTSKTSTPPHDGWEFLLKHERRIRRLCVDAMPFYDSRLIDDLMDVAIDKAPGLVARWDSRRGVCLMQYVFTSLRWWIRKRVKRYYIQKARTERLDEDQDEQFQTDRHDSSHPIVNPKTRATAYATASHEDGLLNQDAVRTIFNRLSTKEIALLRMRHVQGLSFAEIGDKIGWGKTKARRMYYAAMAQAQKVARLCGLTDEHA